MNENGYVHYSSKARLRLTSMNEACFTCISNTRKGLSAVQLCKYCGKALHPSMQAAALRIPGVHSCWNCKSESEAAE